MNMKMASILCLVIMLAGCVAGQQRGLVGDTYVSFSQPAPVSYTHLTLPTICSV